MVTGHNGAWARPAVMAAAVCMQFGTSFAQQGDTIRRQTGIDTGLAVVIGTDVDLAADLAADGRLLVHLLAPDAERAGVLRRAVQQRGLGGRVVVGALGDGHLPHPDRFVNLVVADMDAPPRGAPKPAEVMRVLAVRGAAWLKRQGKWQAVRAPRDGRIDGWFCRWYDATGNCVSNDRLAGFPRAVQWQHGPAMEDGTGDGKIPLVADGRMVCLDARNGELLCRDAGNGTLLWKRYVGLRQNDAIALAAGRVHLWHDAKGEPTSDDKRMGERGPMVALDLAGGEVVKVYSEGLRGGTAAVIEWQVGDRRHRERPVPWFAVTQEAIVQAYGADLVVLDRKTGRRLWHKSVKGATWFSPVVSAGTVLAVEAAAPARRGRHDETAHARAIAAFALDGGGQRWRVEGFHRVHEITDKGRTTRARAGLKPLSAAGKRVLVQTASYQFRQGGSAAVLDAATGREIWYHRFAPKERYTHGSYRAVLRGEEVVVMCGKGVTRFDAATGRLLGHVTPGRSDRRGARANGACAASRATVNWLMANAYLYVGPDGAARTCYGARGQCGQGVVPANGLVLVPPASCDCGDYTRGYQALAPAVAGKAVDDAKRLVRGPGTGRRGTDAAGADWPAFLGGPQRLSAGEGDLAATLAERWRVRAAAVPDSPLDADRRHSERYLGALSAPVAGEGLVVVAAPESHEVLAFDAAGGRRKWAFAAGGKVDSPPTLAGGLAVFGCDDGHVYAVSLADGRSVWTYRLAPTDGVAMHHGHLASSFPVPGSVLVLGGRVVAVAGHHTDIGALHFAVLDLPTGRALARRVVRADQPAVVANALAVADTDGRGFWLGTGIGGSLLHLSTSLEDLPAGGENPGPPIVFDRNGTRVRFRTADGRGGSTHGWKQAMRGGPARGHRMARAGGVTYVVQDPTSSSRHRVNAPKTIILQAASGTWRARKVHWQRTQAEMGNPESFSALIKAGGRLYLGGGRRDGAAGFVQVVDARTGERLADYTMPARVTECGLAAAAGALYVSCEDGHLVCLAGR